MTTQSILLAILLAVPGVIVVIMVLINYEKHIPDYLEDEILENFPVKVKPEIINARVNFADLENLPVPVKRYLKHVLTDGQAFISIIKTKQTGELRTHTSSKKWYQFTAKYLATPITAGFVWGAKVKTPLLTWLRVSDGYICGAGLNKVDLFSIFPVASDSNTPEINSAALYRYLAEAVWYPTALLPESGIQWTPLSNHSALATLIDNDVSVSLEFRFNDDNEVTGIYTPGRYQKPHGKYLSTGWEGHFKNYIYQSGLRVPTYGEVGWYSEGEWQCVWKADVTDIKFNFYSTPNSPKALSAFSKTENTGATASTQQN